MIVVPGGPKRGGRTGLCARPAQAGQPQVGAARSDRRGKRSVVAEEKDRTKEEEQDID